MEIESNVDNNNSKNNIIPEHATYSDLLNIVAELQNDLQHTLTISTRIQNENKALRQRCNILNETHDRSKARLDEAREAFQKNIEQVIVREKRLESSTTGWKCQIQACEKEIEELKDALDAKPNEDKIRIQTENELDLKYTARLEGLQSEVEKWRTNCRKVERENLIRESEFEQYIKLKEGEITSFKQTRLNDLKSIEEMKQEMVKSLTANEQLPHHLNNKVEQQRVIKELEHQVLELKKELEEVNKDLVDIECDKKTQEVSHQTQLKELQISQKMLQVSNNKLKEQLESTSNDKQAIHHKLTETESIIASINLETNSAQRTFALKEAELRKTIEDERYEFSLETSKLNRALESIQKDYSECKSKLSTVEYEKQESEKTLRSKVNAMEEEYDLLKSSTMEEQESLKTNVRQLEATIDKFKVQEQILLLEHKEQLASNNRELDLFKSKCDRLSKSTESQNSIISSNEIILEKIRKDNRSLVERVNLLLKQEEHFNHKLSENQIQSAAHVEKIGELQAQLTQGQVDLEKLEAKHAEAINEHSRQNQIALKNLSDVLEAQIYGLKSQLEKQKKRTTAYKEKAIQAHQNAKKVHRVLTENLSLAN